MRTLQFALVLLLGAIPMFAQLSWTETNWEAGCPLGPGSPPDPAGCSWASLAQIEGSLADIHTYFLSIAVVPANKNTTKIGGLFVLETSDHVMHTITREGAEVKRDTEVPHASLDWFGDHGIVAVWSLDSQEILPDGVTIQHRFRARTSKK